MVNENLIFYKDKLTLILKLEQDLVEFDNKISAFAKGKSLFKKNEFHITIIGNQTGEAINEILKSFSEEERDNILSQIKDLGEDTDWAFSFEPEYYFIQKIYNTPKAENPEATFLETRSSIIQKVELSNLQEFYKNLNKILGSNFEIPFAHITIFTNSSYEPNNLKGIGIYSEDDFKSLSPQKISNLWFKAKEYGWGWQPSSWQGWVVLFVYIGLMFLGFLKLDNNSHSVTDTLINFGPYFILITSALIFICYKKGEKPYWRWGK